MRNHGVYYQAICRYIRLKKDRFKFGVCVFVF